MERIIVSLEKKILIKELNNQLVELDELDNKLESIHDIADATREFNLWKNKTKRILERLISEKDVMNGFLYETKILSNKFVKHGKKNEIGDAIKRGNEFLMDILSDMESISISDALAIDYIDENNALVVLRRLMKNFNYHIQAMYQDKVHGNGKIKQGDLQLIQIGNEYDVQRMLYSLIRPIFPKARLEVSDDTGYRCVRYDIFLDEYSLIIEVKCTRPSMSERDLTEELGSDAFHYEGDNLILFVFDKDNIIKNREAFVDTYKRDKEKFGKNVETIVV
ncbi:TPA: hypothetical protein QCQ12_000604 [Bacillus cereus biovar anthracis]|nr:hypothetical protein [Bacillus cereus biovar anthracis]